MADIRLLVWNMEWMNDLFTASGTFRPDSERTLHMREATVLQRRQHLSKVINELTPDVVVVVEGPNETGELQLFFDTDVAGTWQCHIQRSPGMTQCLGLAVRTDTGKFAATPFTSFDTLVMSAFNEWRYDLDQDRVPEVFKFERSPLYATVHLAGGQNFAVLGLHLKSKLVASAMEWSRWWATADGNRKKILAQAQRIRTAFLDKYLRDAATAQTPMVVCGDVNDGPGLDESERRLLGSGMEKLMGDIWFPDLTLGNALFDILSEKEKEDYDFEGLATTTFSDPIFNNTFHKVWIDHILYTRNRQNWIGQAAIHTKLRDGRIWETPYKFSSDHHPISAIIQL